MTQIPTSNPPPTQFSDPHDAQLPLDSSFRGSRTDGNGNCGGDNVTLLFPPPTAASHQPGIRLLPTPPGHCRRGICPGFLRRRRSPSRTGAGLQRSPSCHARRQEIYGKSRDSHNHNMIRRSLKPPRHRNLRKTSSPAAALPPPPNHQQQQQQLKKLGIIIHYLDKFNHPQSPHLFYLLSPPPPRPARHRPDHTTT